MKAAINILRLELIVVGIITILLAEPWEAIPRLPYCSHTEINGKNTCVPYSPSENIRYNLINGLALGDSLIMNLRIEGNQNNCPAFINVPGDINLFLYNSVIDTGLRGNETKIKDCIWLKSKKQKSND